MESRNQQSKSTVVGFNKVSIRGFLREGTIKLWFDSVWMGVTGGAMAGATSRGWGCKNICKLTGDHYINVFLYNPGHVIILKAFCSLESRLLIFKYLKRLNVFRFLDVCSLIMFI